MFSKSRRSRSEGNCLARNKSVFVIKAYSSSRPSALSLPLFSSSPSFRYLFDS
ncbi:hypothetical protein HMPREF1990_01481 [Porphyromonas gingivalis W4087]|uniref:Uncharacterized protein n=1 Tax=Porphyromonas gingivalis F0570 TaxID=1227271 RepID=A0A0E2LRH0_PORGN|nr:hypothetical protein HMPREF1554_01477 [Porphyromonas gingivalis F0569]ERJ66682.1 hypothetical protein HMPREF1555_01012 [Porphyromonas gingivalis F0570]ERJ68060.1 hypothetical protein HMPREF1553_01244 [Porphyromonas gingivalis F0568]ERJ88162.1 hypothetical protein HMPREF1990_01481 [Porphyromonas gingivalis W4087]